MAKDTNRDNNSNNKNSQETTAKVAALAYLRKENQQSTSHYSAVA